MKLKNVIKKTFQPLIAIIVLSNIILESHRSTYVNCVLDPLYLYTHIFIFRQETDEENSGDCWRSNLQRVVQISSSFWKHIISKFPKVRF